jgi:hypothetical protein
MSIQGRTWESNVDLSLSQVSVPGILPTAITVKYRRAGDTTLQTKAMDSTNWVEVGGAIGLYILKWSTAEMGNIGAFWYQVTGPAFDKHIEKMDVIPAQVGSIISPTKCVVTGNLADISGSPDQDSVINFRIVKTPATFQGALATGRVLHTTADSYGTFSVTLVRGAVVIVEIERAGLRQQFTVPDLGSANLIDLLPPINN